LVIIPFKTLIQGQSPHPSIHQFLLPSSQTQQTFFLSLVPTQLSRFIHIAQAENSKRLHWLRQFRAIFLGGAPASTALLTQARQLQLNLAPCYGMTETAAQVMTLHPKEFLAGTQPPGQILPHVTMQLVASSPQSNSGQLQWSGPSTHLGYYPQAVESDHFLTEDRAEMNQDGSLRFRGRASRMILSGGENIYPEEIEAVLMAMSEIQDVCVFGMPDDDWGEIAIAAYVLIKDPIAEDSLRQTVKKSLASYKCPKVWWSCVEIPRNAQGKVALKQLQDHWKKANKTKLTESYIPH
jgi:O-succinylbenzoic acid--CoA ligase